MCWEPYIRGKWTDNKETLETQLNEESTKIVDVHTRQTLATLDPHPNQMRANTDETQPWHCGTQKEGEMET